MELTPNKRRQLEIASSRLRVEFGQEPGSYEYEISESDRAYLEQAVRDTRSDDSLLAAAASAAISAAAYSLPGGPLIVSVGSFLWNFLGKLFSGEGSLSPSAITFEGYRPQSDYGENRGIVVVKSLALKEGICTLKGTIMATAFGVGPETGSGRYFGYTTGRVGVSSGAVDTFVSGLSIGGGFSGQSASGISEEEIRNTYEEENRASNVEVSAPLSSLSGLELCGYNVAADGSHYGWSCRDATTPIDEKPVNLDSLSGDFGMGDSSLSDVTPDQAREFINHLKNNPDYTSDPTQPGGDPPPGEWSAPDPEGGPTGNPPIIGGSDGPGGGHVTLPPDYDPDDPNYEPGKEICFIHDGIKKCHKIRHRDGPRVEYDSPPYGDQTFNKPWCKKRGTKVNAMIRELALDLGMSANLVVVEGCEKRWPGGCFKKGTNKLDALWELQDLCGYGIFNPPGGGTESGPITPINVFHDYHENDNLIEMEPVVDDSELYRKVVVWKRRRNGQILDVPVTVAGTTLLPEDRIYYRAVPRNTSEADMLDLAHNLADRYALKTKMVHFLVPYKLSLAPRHQVTLRVPSQGFTGVYMVWPDSVVHSTENVESLWTTEARGAELSVERYAPRFEYVE